MNERRTLRIGASWLVFALIGLALQAGEPLTLRVGDTVARPGGRVAIVFRTYQPQPVSQGQVCFFGRPLARGVSTAPIVAMEQAVVWSDTGDAIVTSATMTGGAVPEIELAFQSATSGINNSDGPMAMVVFRLAEDAAVGALLEFGIDPSATFLLDDQGQPLPLELRAGEVEVIATDEPLELALEGEPTPAGMAADLYLSLEEVMPLDRAQLTLRYDPAPFAALPNVMVDPRYGNVDVTVRGTPGELVLTLEADAGPIRWGEVPGELLTLRLVPHATTSHGAWPLRFDPANSFVVVDEPPAPPIVLLDGMVRLLPPGAVFVDGFDSGDTEDWTAQVPASR